MDERMELNRNQIRSAIIAYENFLYSEMKKKETINEQGDLKIDDTTYDKVVGNNS